MVTGTKHFGQRVVKHHQLLGGRSCRSSRRCLRKEDPLRHPHLRRLHRALAPLKHPWLRLLRSLPIPAPTQRSSLPLPPTESQHSLDRSCWHGPCSTPRARLEADKSYNQSIWFFYALAAVLHFCWHDDLSHFATRRVKKNRWSQPSRLHCICCSDVCS